MHQCTDLKSMFLLNPTTQFIEVLYHTCIIICCLLKHLIDQPALLRKQLFPCGLLVHSLGKKVDIDFIFLGEKPGLTDKILRLEPGRKLRLKEEDSVSPYHATLYQHTTLGIACIIILLCCNIMPSLIIIGNIPFAILGTVHEIIDGQWQSRR